MDARSLYLVCEGYLRTQAPNPGAFQAGSRFSSDFIEVTTSEVVEMLKEEYLEITPQEHTTMVVDTEYCVVTTPVEIAKRRETDLDEEIKEKYNALSRLVRTLENAYDIAKFGEPLKNHTDLAEDLARTRESLAVAKEKWFALRKAQYERLLMTAGFIH